MNIDGGSSTDDEDSDCRTVSPDKIREIKDKKRKEEEEDEEKRCEDPTGSLPPTIPKGDKSEDDEDDDETDVDMPDPSTDSKKPYAYLDAYKDGMFLIIICIYV